MSYEIVPHISMFNLAASSYRTKTNASAAIEWKKLELTSTG